MKLVNSILVMKHRDDEAFVIDSVLLVKHPEGSDHTRLIHAALSRSTTVGKEWQLLQEADPQSMADITRIDWSVQQMHIEAAASWFVLDIDQCLGLAQPDPYSPCEYVVEPALTIA